MEGVGWDIFWNNTLQTEIAGPLIGQALGKSSQVTGKEL